MRSGTIERRGEACTRLSLSLDREGRARTWPIIISSDIREPIREQEQSEYPLASVRHDGERMHSWRCRCALRMSQLRKSAEKL
jgi:hypothetical protein